MAASSNENFRDPPFAIFLLLCAIAFYIGSHACQEHSSFTQTWIIFRSITPKNFSFTCAENVTCKYKTTCKQKTRTCIVLLLLIAGDIQMNPGPKQASIFPCGTCDVPVTWSQEGICCNNCSIWYHKCCEDISKDMSYLNRSSVIWHCFKCDSLNVDSFTYNSYEITSSNYYMPLLSPVNSTFDSVDTSHFSPIQASSPISTSPNRTSHTSTRSKSHVPAGNSENSSSACPSKSANLRLMTINCCGIRANKSEFHAAMDYIKPDVVCGTESWLKGIKPGKDPDHNAIKSCEVFPDNITVTRNDRSQGVGGGVFIGTNNQLVQEPQPQLGTDCEIVWTKVRLKNRKDLNICSFYMPHRDMKSITCLNDSLKKLTDGATDKHVILAGDFNCPSINWDSLSVEKGAPDRDVQQALINLSIEHGLKQIHRQPTRENNLLDLVFTSNPSLVKASHSVPGISDHAMIVTDIDILPNYVRQNKRRMFNFNRANWDQINSDLEHLHSDLLNFENQSIDALWELFKERISETIHKHVPSRMSKKRKSLPWFNRKLRCLARKKSRLFKRAKETGKWANFKTFQKQCKKDYKKAEIDYLNNTLQQSMSENNTKPFWRYIKSKRQDKIGVQPLKRRGILFSDAKTKAQILIDQFKSVFTKHNQSRPETTKKAKHTIKPLKITSKGVEKLLKELEIHKSIGPDNIPNIILKNCAKHIAPALRHIYQTSINNGKLPLDWRSANVTPVFKKGDTHLAENYRPVSLTCVSCKVLEHIICKHMLNHLENNQILTSLNHGFRSGYSCETQLLTTVHDLLQKHDEGAQTDIVILDFSKAFDTVPHESLLYKMEQYGINGNLNNWLRDFLTNRSMRVVIDGEASESVKVESGVPQGTVLGPLAFLCHINDLPDSVKSTVRLFADDCLLYRRINSRQDHIQLQADLQRLEEWAATWGMRFNAKKCYVMSINNKSSNFYELNEHILQQVDENPYLGVTFSNNLKFSSHINKISSKASSTLGFLKRNLKHCPVECRKTAYLSLVRSTLEYSSIVWDPHLQKDIDKLEQIQRRAARFISGNYTSREPGCVTRLLEDLKLQPLQDRRKIARLTFFYKVTEGLVPAMPIDAYLTPIRGKRLIKPKEFKDCHSTNFVAKQAISHTKCFQTFTCNSTIYKNSFFPKTVIEWNNLSEDVVRAKSVQCFKTALTKCD